MPLLRITHKPEAADHFPRGESLDTLEATPVATNSVSSRLPGTHGQPRRSCPSSEVLRGNLHLHLSERFLFICLGWQTLEDA